jgi:hypothetical protein
MKQKIGIIGRNLKDAGRLKKQLHNDGTTKFILISKPEHAMSYRLNAVIQTQCAYLNRYYQDILNSVALSLEWMPHTLTYKEAVEIGLKNSERLSIIE